MGLGGRVQGEGEIFINILLNIGIVIISLIRLEFPLSSKESAFIYVEKYFKEF